MDGHVLSGGVHALLDVHRDIAHLQRAWKHAGVMACRSVPPRLAQHAFRTHHALRRKHSKCYQAWQLIRLRPALQPVTFPFTLVAVVNSLTAIVKAQALAKYSTYLTGVCLLASGPKPEVNIGFAPSLLDSMHF